MQSSSGIIEEAVVSQLRQLVTLPIDERHQQLQTFIPDMVEDFANDPELTEFSILDTADWEMAKQV